METRKIRGLEQVQGEIDDNVLKSLVFTETNELIEFKFTIQIEVEPVVSLNDDDTFSLGETLDIFVIGERMGFLQLVPDVDTHRFEWGSKYLNQNNEENYVQWKIKEIDGLNTLIITLNCGDKIFELLTGHAELKLGDTQILEIFITTETMKVKAPELILSFNLFYEKGSVTYGIPIEAPDSVQYPITLKLTPANGNTETLFEYSKEDQFTRGKDWSVALAFDETKKNSFNLTAFENSSVSESMGIAIERVDFEIKSVKFADWLEFESAATITFKGGKTATANGSINFTEDLILSKSRLNFQLNDKIDLPDGESPFSLHVKEGVQIGLSLDALDSYLSFSMSDKSPPAEISVPGRSGDNSDQKFFILDVKSDDPDSPAQRCRINSNGLQLEAIARNVTVNMGEILPEVNVNEGSIGIVDNKFSLLISAVAKITDYFRGASGKLTVTASNAKPKDENENSITPDVHVKFEPNVDSSWVNSIGYLQVNNPRVWVSVDWNSDENEWTVNGEISGSLFLNEVPDFGDPFTADFLKEIFGSLQLEFEKLNLEQLTKGGTNLAGNLSIRAARAIQIKLWSILQLQLVNFKIGFDSIEFGGNLDIEFGGGASFRGSLPNLKIGWNNENKPHLEAGIAFGGMITIPSGLQASVEFIKGEYEISGSGSLSIPGLPMVRILCSLGKKDDVPLFMIFAQMDYPITLFPGVVLRDLGLGLGINKVLRGFETNNNEKTETTTLSKLLGSPDGLPNPSQLQDWVISDISPTFSLIASSKIAPSPTGDGLMPYVGEVILSLQFSDDPNIALLTNLWLFTELKNTRNPEYMSHPVAKGVIILFPRFGRLEGKFMTSKSPKMDAASELLAKALDMVEAEVSFLATPDIFKFRVGPVKVATRLSYSDTLIIDVQGTMITSTEVSSGRVLAASYLKLRGILASRLSFSARFGSSIDFWVGWLQASVDISVSLSLRAEYSDECVYVGIVSPNNDFEFYGRRHIYLKVDLTLNFSFYASASIEIDLLFDSYTQSFSKEWHERAVLSLTVDAEVEGLLSSKGMAISGSGRLEFSLFGFHFSQTLSIDTANDAQKTKIAELRGQVPQLMGGFF